MKQAKEKKPSANVSSIDKAFDIINYLYEKDGEASIADISKSLEMNKSTVYRVLNAVKATGYIYQNEETQNYGLSMRFYQIGMRLQNGNHFLRAYASYAKELNEKYNEVVTVAARELAVNDLPRYLELYGFRSSHSLTLRYNPGNYSPAHCTASGKCLLAFSRDSYINRYDGCELPRRTQYTITNWSQLKLELEKIRKQGYSIDNEEYEIGLVGIATPLFAPNGNIVGALSLTLPLERYRMLDIEKVLQDMKAISDLKLEI